MAALALVIAGGIYLAAHIPQHVPLAPAIVLLVLSIALVAYNLFTLTRIPGFAWGRFAYVGKRAGAAYVFIAAMIEYAFLRDSLSGGPLVILTLSLVVFAVQVPTLIAFTSARFATLDDGAPGPSV
jgi:hypothetical protein